MVLQQIPKEARLGRLSLKTQCWRVWG